ncbi:uncharacterized protein LOC110467212 [Mizuhopecten yessoensis]|uniref:Uncharacterized protein n=1 Tax=Mizuhopecten yessoensis TaxID=6573 RepID=A0A210PMA5_MIZYE|nr:uncharacterized protein LOC110467212 [Mizuhopecten yessoensis]OWF37625.1 hypothetical protein KP79_PYT07909 [Mizuhopecten yessoensis]
MKKQGTVDRLKIKGTPAPRNTPTSPLLSMSKANRASNPNVAAVDRSYEFVLRKANRKALEQMPAGPSHITRRMDFLNRIQNANFGISTMDSPYITSEGTVVDDQPKFVLCGQPLNGCSSKSFVKYFSDQRVGSYKTSAQEMYRARHNIKTRARSEPAWRTTDNRNGDSSSAKTEFKDNRSMHSSSFISVPSSASESVTFPAMRPSPVDRNKSSFELKGRSFKPVNGLNLGFSSSVSGDFVISKSPSRVSKDDKKETVNTTTAPNESGKAGSAFLHINNDPQEVTIAPENGTEFPKYNKSFAKKGVRFFNNPYRLLKNRERQVAIRTQNLDMKSVQKITNMNTDNPSESEKVLENLPKGESSEQLLLEMMFDVNGQRTRRSHVSGKYSDIALHRDLDEYMVVRTPPSSTRDSPVKSHRGKSGRRYLDELEEESHWAGNDISEARIINRIST